MPDDVIEVPGIPYTRTGKRLEVPVKRILMGTPAEQAALREVLEETGLRATILRLLGTIEYFFRAGEWLIHKKVDFYLMRYEGQRGIRIRRIR